MPRPSGLGRILGHYGLEGSRQFIVSCRDPQFCSSCIDLVQNNAQIALLSETNHWHFAATIFSDSTFSVGAVVAPAAPVTVAGVTVPVSST